jgi:excisionase family DNA binding protein
MGGSNVTATKATELVDDGLLTVPEAAEFLKLSRSALYTMMRNHDLDFVILGRHRRIPRNAVVALARKGLAAKPRGWKGATNRLRPSPK